VAALALTAAGCLTAHPSAHAAGTDISVGVAPALLEVQPSPIGPATYPITVFNDGSVACDIEVLFYDFAVSPDGEVMIAEGEPGSESFSAATWMEVSDSRFALEPDEERDVMLSVHVPPDAEPGTHRALVDFRASSASGPMAQEGVTLRPNVATVVLVGVPGDAAADPQLTLDLPLVCLSDPVASVTLCNDGSAHCFAEGSVVFARPSALTEPLAEVAFDVPPWGALVLPAEERALEARWTDPPLVGRYTAVADIAVSDCEPLGAQRTFWIVRWPLLAGAAVVAVLGLLGVVLSRRYAVVPRNSRNASNDSDLRES